MQASVLCARMEVWIVIELTTEAREQIRQIFLELLPTLSDFALWHIALVLLDEEGIRGEKR